MRVYCGTVGEVVLRVCPVFYNDVSQPFSLSLSLFYIIPSLSSSFLALLDDTSNHEKCNS